MRSILIFTLSVMISCGEKESINQKKSSKSTNNETSLTSNNTEILPEDGGEGFELLAEELGYTTYLFTEKDYQFFGDPRAIKGGTLRHITSRFPNTLRIVGQNSNYQENSTIAGLCYESLISTHPVTLDFIPVLATHWKISDDKIVFRCFGVAFENAGPNGSQNQLPVELCSG